MVEKPAGVGRGPWLDQRAVRKVSEREDRINKLIVGVAIFLVACRSSDSRQKERRLPDDAPHAVTIRPPAPAGAPRPLLIQKIEAGDPPASMVVVTTKPRFYIDRTEVTAGDYRECIEAAACTHPSSDNWKRWDAKRPVTVVSPTQASEYCAYRGKRLPSQSEWMRAALGDDGRKYPWGNQAPTCKLAVMESCPGIRDVVNVGSRPEGASPYGALDMAGNVGEFVSLDKPGDREWLNVVAVGGSFETTASEISEYFQSPARSDNAMDDEQMGFRCALTPKP